MPPNHLQHANEDLDKATKAAAIDAAEWEQLKKSLKKIKQP